MSNKITMLFTIANIDINDIKENNVDSLANIQESLQETKESLQENWKSILSLASSALLAQLNSATLLMLFKGSCC